MDDDFKKQLLANVGAPLAVSLARLGVNHHFSMRQIEQQKEMAVEVAERRQQGVREMARVKGAEPGTVRRAEPVGDVGPDADVYDELTALKSETGCEFCHSVIDSLMDAPPSEARSGLDELQSYVREVDRIRGSDVDEHEAEEIISGLVDRWEVVPKYAVDLA